MVLQPKKLNNMKWRKPHYRNRERKVINPSLREDRSLLRGKLWKVLLLTTKQRVQARHLTSSVMEVFIMFTEEYRDVKIRKNKFASLRPLHVQLSNKQPHNVCLCKYHENFILAINALHAHCPNIPNYNYELPGELFSCPSTRDCWLT